MVWGMGNPPLGGPYGPYGKFEGWSGNLTKYYLQQPSDIQKVLFDCPIDPEVAPEHHPYDAALKYPFYVSEKFRNGVGAPLPHLPPVTPILDHEVPQVYVIEKTYNELASFISLNNGILAVDGAFKGVIEKLEPGVHRFFPIEIRMPKGNTFPKTFYTLAIGQYLDSFVPDDSEEGSFRIVPNSHNKVSYDESKKSITGLALSRNAFGSANLWCEERFSRLLACFSDDLQSEIDKAGLLMPKHYKMIEV